MMVKDEVVLEGKLEFVYCDGENLNEQLMENNLGIIDRRFCEKSEFSDDKWVKPYC
jgi:hypothetical protein